MQFNINDEVIVKSTNDVGTITDKMRSEANGDFLYIITLNSGRSYMRRGDDLESVKQAEYKVETEIADNVVIGIIYEIIDGKKFEVCRGHGHIIHKGVEGIAQACAYAYKKALAEVDTGIYHKQNRRGRK
jgi:hypothetical protein